MRILFLLSALLSTSATAQQSGIPPSLEAAILDWQSCATLNSFKVADFPEPIETLADAVVGQCAGELNIMLVERVKYLGEREDSVYFLRKASYEKEAHDEAVATILSRKYRKK